MKRMVAAVAVAVGLIAASPVMAETLTNANVVALVASGIGDEAVIAKIRSTDHNFQLGTDDLITLKQKGVPGTVIAAMLTPAATAAAGLTPTYSINSADPMVAHPAGVYLLDLSAPEAKMARIDPTVTNQAKTGGILGYAFTGGLASMSVKAALQNETARVHTQNGAPTFYFFFDEANGNVGGSSAWSSGTAATVTSPNEFTLIKLMKKSGRREARVGSVNIGGAKTGVMDKDRIPFDYVMVRPGVFKATATTPLQPGEYGFIYSLAGGGAGGAMTARVFDFSVPDAPKTEKR